MNKNSITVKDLTKIYTKSEKPAVKNVSFYVEKGSFFSLLGPNGAGKTTTISILTTLLQKTSGTVTVAGFDVQKQPNQVRQQIGVIFQNPSLDQNLTAEENIRFHCNLYHLYPYRPSFSLMPQSYQEKVLELAEVLDLVQAIHKPVKALSGGMKRKLEIIRSLMHEPEILFLDEPTTGLDPLSRRNLWEYLQHIREKNDITIFLTTHYLEEAEASDYICIINNGALSAKGTPRELKDQLLTNTITLNSKHPKKLKKELAAHSDISNISGDGPFVVEYSGPTAQPIIASLQTQLSELNITIPTLEDAYLSIIQKK